MEQSKTVLVTGGTGGIGTEVCRTLVLQNATVFANYHPAEADRVENWLQTQSSIWFR